MDKRLIYGVLAVIIVLGGLYVFVINKPPTPPENGNDNGNGVVVPPEDKAIIEGVVSDEAGDPVSGATVTVDGETVTTGSDGAYSFEVDAGSYTVSVSKDGYDDVSSILTAVADTDYTVDLAILETETDTGPDRVELKIITRHGSDILFKARAAFLETDIAAEYGITEREQIKFLGVSSSLWTDTITRSGDVDIAWGGGPVVFDIVNSEGLLSPLESEEVTAILDIIPDEISGAASKRIIDGDVMWVGSAISSFGFTINKEFLQSYGLPEPTTWMELGNETYAQFIDFPSVSAIGTADATLSTSNTRMFEIILQTYGWKDGWELLTLMGANSRIFDKSESVRDAAIQGSIGAGTTIDFYGYTAQLELPDLCKYILPQDGTAVNADPIALVSTSEEPEAAQAFIAWVLSPEGQEIWLDETINRMPINPAVFDTTLGQTRPDLEESYTRTLEAITIDFSDELALSYETAMMFFFKGTLVEAQIDLIDTWIELVDAEDAGDITHKEFLGLVEDLGNPLNIEFTDPETGGTVTFTESYAQSINDRITTDADFKSTLRDAWRAAAIVRYNAVLDDLNDLTG
ncbi:MAG: extracellular solute-binding protein [Candidatus Bathyarchaeota archaeon]